MDDQLEHRAWVRPILDELEREIRKARELSWERVWELEWDYLKFGGRDYFTHHWARSTKLVAILDELSFAASDLCVDDETVKEFEKGTWSIASEFVALKSRKIHRGFLKPVLEIPVPLPVTMHLFALIKIEGDRNHLIRENHNFGIHYHYVLADKRRTTTLICWDTRWVSPDKSDPKGNKSRPLFHQLHNDSSKGVSATPDRWGAKKRKSVRAACEPDLGRQNIVEFLCAADDATAVWPMSLKVTPRPVTPVLKPASKSRRNSCKSKCLMFPYPISISGCL